MSISLTAHHIALSSSDNIKEICSPLERLGINYFSFVRSYKNGSHIRLSNNPAWTQHYYKREFYNVILKQVLDSEGNILWSNIDKYPLFYEASEFFDVDNGTVIVLTIDDVTERYFFGSTKANRQVNHIYIHQLDLLKIFILYFKETAKILIEKAEKTKIIVPQKQPCVNDMYNPSQINNFLNEIKINKVCVRVKGQDFYISSNEAKILSLMKCGYTAKEISKEVGLKQKTIEIYRDKLKSKLDLFTRGHLVSLAMSNSLLNIKLINK